MNPPYANTFTVVLAVVATVGCVGRFDYNIVLALGWLYLAGINPYLTNSLGFYVMVFGSILIDVISIVLSMGKGGRFTDLFIPLLEIVIKIGIVSVCAYEYFKSKNGQSQGLSNQQRQRSNMENH